MSDVMHGPKVSDGRRRRKTFLMAFIDDATRALPFAAFDFSESTTAFLPVLKSALTRRGLPLRLYVDNGANYRSHQLALVCAKLGIALIHARPWQPAGKGEIERFFRTLRAAWLERLDADATSSLEALKHPPRVVLVLKHQHRVIGVTDLKRPSPKPRLHFVLEPQVQHLVQIDVRKRRRDHPTLRRAPLRITQLARLHHPGVQPLPDCSSYHTVSHPSVQKAPQVPPIHASEEVLDVQVNDPSTTEVHQAFP